MNIFSTHNTSARAPSNALIRGATNIMPDKKYWGGEGLNFILWALSRGFVPHLCWCVAWTSLDWTLMSLTRVLSSYSWWMEMKLGGVYWVSRHSVSANLFTRG